MRYVSTRGEAPALGFSEAVLAGLAKDGGLYLPETWPRLSHVEIAAFAGRSYQDIAFEIVSRFADGEIAAPALRSMLNDAYAGFRHEAVAPLSQLAPNHFLLELFHGPTLAFKDLAMQFLARLMDHILAEQNGHALIVAATSGDTGGAAIEAFRGRKRIDIAVLFPDKRVSDVQRRQMTTCRADNVQAIAIDGTFDDCQALVKAMFADQRFRERTRLSAVNSINFGRIVAQIVYYFTSAVALGSPTRPVSFTVPTGNFGNVFAGYAAKRMGLPIERLIVATNANDILDRAFRSGRYEVKGVAATSSPSMDIEVSSNFERLLFEAGGRDTAGVRRSMAGLSQSGAFALGEKVDAAIAEDFESGSADEAATAATIKRIFRKSEILLDPHTAVGVSVAEKHLGATPMVTHATAHPAKFPDAVEAASGKHAALPEWTAKILSLKENYRVLPADLATVERAIEERVGASKALA